MTQKQTHIFDDMISSIETETSLSEHERNTLLKKMSLLKQTKVNILITGATGCGKSSTINALFQTSNAKIGTGVDPETMDIHKYELDNIVLFDSPGLGDGKEADRNHAKNIIDKLLERDANGEFVIDLVLVLLDGSTRDLGTSFELINNVIIPNLGDDASRLLVAINQADVAMKGKYWNHERNEPEPQLVAFLEDKVASTQRRIHEATGIDTTPIYYSAGYKDGDEQQYPYNLSKLLAHILRHTREDKRVVFMQDLNRQEEMWQKDDQLENYQEEIKSSILSSLAQVALKAVPAVIESLLPAVGRALPTVARTIVVVGSRLLSSVSSWFR